MDDVMSGLTLAAALGAGLVGGIFFAFSAFIMAALGRLPPEGGIRAMQSINVVVLNPVFFFAFFGTAVAALVLAVAAFAGWSPPHSLYLLAGALLYSVGTIFVTMAFNVPLNNRLASAGRRRKPVEVLSVGVDGLESRADDCFARRVGIFHLRPSLRDQPKGDDPMAYVDGFIVPVPKKKLAEYRSIARKAGKVWRDHGALDYKECVADDVKVGKWTSFPRSVKKKPNETVIFSYIVYRSRAHRDKVNAKVMKDKRIAAMMTPGAMPFDLKRMIYGGFKVIVA